MLESTVVVASASVTVHAFISQLLAIIAIILEAILIEWKAYKSPVFVVSLPRKCTAICKCSQGHRNAIR